MPSPNPRHLKQISPIFFCLDQHPQPILHPTPPTSPPPKKNKDTPPFPFFHPKKTQQINLLEIDLKNPISYHHHPTIQPWAYGWYLTPTPWSMSEWEGSMSISPATPAYPVKEEGKGKLGKIHGSNRLLKGCCFREDDICVSFRGGRALSKDGILILMWV